MASLYENATGLVDAMVGLWSASQDYKKDTSDPAAVTQLGNAAVGMATAIGSTLTENPTVSSMVGIANVQSNLNSYLQDKEAFDKAALQQDVEGQAKAAVAMTHDVVAASQGLAGMLAVAGVAGAAEAATELTYLGLGVTGAAIAGSTVNDGLNWLQRATRDLENSLLNGANDQLDENEALAGRINFTPPASGLGNSSSSSVTADRSDRVYFTGDDGRPIADVMGWQNGISNFLGNESVDVNPLGATTPSVDPVAALAAYDFTPPPPPYYYAAPPPPPAYYAPPPPAAVSQQIDLRRREIAEILCLS